MKVVSILVLLASCAISFWLGRRYAERVLIISSNEEGLSVEVGSKAEAAEKSLFSGEPTKITLMKP